MIFKRLQYTWLQIIYLSIKLMALLLAFYILGSTLILYQGF